jgi:uncharacterized delta-60 repeat protein
VSRTRWLGRAAALGASCVATLALTASSALAAAGDLDPSFDGDGKLILPFDGQPEATLVQPDGKIVIAGSYPSSNFTVRRLNSDGSLDKSFDGDGTAVADLGADDQAFAAALQPDGKIVVAGRSSSSNTYQAAVARFDTDGSLDESFDPGGGDGDGKKVFASLHGAAAVLLQGDGKIVIGGYYYARFGIVRLDTKGAPDGTTFEPAVVKAENSEYVNAAALAPDGRIVLAGVTIPNGPEPSRAAFAVYNAGGKLDTSFADTGTLALEPDPLGAADAVLVQPDGKIVAAGMANPIDPRMVVVRLDRAGKVDATFGAGGTAVADFAGEDAPAAATLAPDGKLLLAGTAGPPGEFAAARLSPGGALDASFGSGGQTTFGFDSINLAYSAALQPDGKLVIAGRTAVGGTVPHMAVARLVADPPADGGTVGGGTVGGGPVGGDPDVSASAPRCAGKQATIVGTTGRDALRGTRRADVIVALGGNDRVLARGGNDLVCGGPGNDRLAGGSGADRLAGGRGRDVLSGGPGRDRLAGGPQRDTCVAASARDRASGCEIKQQTTRRNHT